MDWDWVKKVAPTVAIVGTFIGMFFLFDDWQAERFSHLAGNVEEVSKRMGRVEARLAGDIAEVSKRMGRVEARLAGDIAEVSKRVDRVETLSAAAVAQTHQQPGDSVYVSRAFGIVGSETIVQLLAGKRTTVPIAYVAPRAAELSSLGMHQVVEATYSDNTLTLYPAAGDSKVIALLREEGWRLVDPKNIADGFFFWRSPSAN